MPRAVVSVAKRMRPPLGWVARFQTGSRTTSFRRPGSRQSAGAFSRNHGRPYTGNWASGKGIQRITLFLPPGQDHADAVAGTERERWVGRHMLTGGQRELEALRDRRQQEYAFHHRERL